MSGASSKLQMNLLQLKAHRLGRAATEGCPLLSAVIKGGKKKRENLWQHLVSPRLFSWCVQRAVCQVLYRCMHQKHIQWAADRAGMFCI